MSELRWTLLILGVVFIAALSWWERRRPRQAFAPRLREPSLSHGSEPRADREERSAMPGSPALEGLEGMSRETANARPGALPSGTSSGTAQHREPWIGDTGLSDVGLSEMALSGDGEAHGPAGDGPVRAHRETAAGPLEELPTLIIPDADEQLALKAAWDEAPPEPTLIDPEASATAATPAPGEAAEPHAAAEPEEAQETIRAQARSPAETAGPAASAGLESEIVGAEGVGTVRIVESAPCGDAAPEPIVDWPSEESRRILALRLVAPQAERFPGRALRLALAAEGFVLGKFSIFHKPDDANRAVLSAASLTRPGAFDLETMDSQRYGGLSLFAVLPGPKTPPQAFEELLAAARNLNERLQGALQDERGGPLTPLRVAGLRESLRAQAANFPAASAAAHET